MSYVANVEKIERIKERHFKNFGRKLRDREKEKEPYPKKITRLDVVGLEETGEDDESKN